MKVETQAEIIFRYTDKEDPSKNIERIIPKGTILTIGKDIPEYAKEALVGIGKEIKILDKGKPKEEEETLEEGEQE